MDVGQLFNKATTSGVSSREQVSSADQTEYTKGRTIGKPTLSKEAAKYYEELKKKYGDMDFILVSEDQKENAQNNISSYTNPNKPVVLINEDKIERMATDESYRKQYEGIISAAKTQLPQLKQSLAASGANVQGYGIKVNDNGTASFFAIMGKSMDEQREKLAEKRAEKKAEAKAEAKKAEAKKAEQKREEKRAEKAENTVTSDSIEGLLKAIQDQQLSFRSDNVFTESELSYGRSVDFRG